MTNLIKNVARALVANLNPVEQGMHFHGSAQGTYVCDDAACTEQRGGEGRPRR
jgi:hypothetical protein